MSAGTCECPEDCGRPIWRRRYGKACYDRWCRAGQPASGPPPPMSRHDRGILGARATWEKSRPGDLSLAGVPGDDDAPPLEPDEYDLAWLAAEPDRRAERAKPLARDWIRCVHRSDVQGLRILAGKVGDWPALAVVLAECASPERTLVATSPARRQEVTA